MHECMNAIGALAFAEGLVCVFPTIDRRHRF